MNYVWAQRKMEEHRESPQTIGVPSLDLKEKEDGGKCRELWLENWGNKMQRENRYWENILAESNLHSRFSPLLSVLPKRDASTVWQNTPSSSCLTAHKGWAATWVHFSPPAPVCIYLADSPGTVDSQIGVLSKSPACKVSTQVWMADIKDVCKTADHRNISRKGWHNTF